MNFRSKLVAIVGSGLILASSITMGSAATGNATVSITSNTTDNYLAVSITNAPFISKPYSFVDQTTTGDLTVTVTDTRGTKDGWNVTMTGADFQDGSKNFDISNLRLTAGTITPVAVGPNFPAQSPAGISATSALPVLETGGTKVLSAAIGSGAGKFDLPMSGSLNIPGGTLVGDYTSVITVSVVSGP